MLRAKSRHATAACEESHEECKKYLDKLAYKDDIEAERERIMEMSVKAFFCVQVREIVRRVGLWPGRTPARCKCASCSCYLSRISCGALGPSATERRSSPSAAAGLRTTRFALSLRRNGFSSAPNVATGWRWSAGLFQRHAPSAVVGPGAAAARANDRQRARCRSWSQLSPSIRLRERASS